MSQRETKKSQNMFSASSAFSAIFNIRGCLRATQARRGPGQATEKVGVTALG